VAGGAGYLGSILTEELQCRGYGVICLDSFFFGNNPPFSSGVQVVKGDIRTIDRSIFRGVSAVVDLAAVSQPDSANLLGPQIYHSINYRGAVRFAGLAKKSKVERYILASTCSVYGSQHYLLSEASPAIPNESYGLAKLKAETDVLKLADRDFTVTTPRFATLYGLSPKMRFDLILNGMTLSLFKHRRLRVMRSGKQWRPIVHVKDVASALIKIVESDKSLVQKQVFNVGSNNQNFQIVKLASVIGEEFGSPYYLEWYGSPDKRSYRVDFTKIKTLNYATRFEPKDGVQEISEALKNGATEESSSTDVIRWYRHLLNSGVAKP